MARYTIDTTHSQVELSIRHLVVARVRGRFTRFGGTLELDPVDIRRSSVTAAIETASVTTDDDTRDAHLRSADFLDVETWPLITFASTRVEVVGPHLHVTGELTIRDTTRPVLLRVEQLGLATDPWGNRRAAFSATTSIDRKDFGLRWNQILEAGGLLVGDTVEIGLDVEAVEVAGVAVPAAA